MTYIGYFLFIGLFCKLYIFIDLNIIDTIMYVMINWFDHF